jgi:ribonuclease BN (tRNA processing enzyme)
VKLKLLPSSFEKNGSASARQHLTCFLIDDVVAIDAGSLAMAISDEERPAIHDVVLTHAHLDHIAGLPLFIDDQFSSVEQPIRIHATSEVIEVLERDIFNWSIYPRFSELENSNGPVIEYRPFEQGTEFTVGHLAIRSIAVNHKVPCSGFVISDSSSTIAITGDTAGMDSFWESLTDTHKLDALLIECAFPNELEELAGMSHHLTPKQLGRELEKFKLDGCPIFAINIKPAYRQAVVEQIGELGIAGLSVLEIGKSYQW